MFLKDIELNNFKNYDELSLSFDRKCNVIFGDNAQGKTNLLESIYYLATLSLFRTLTLDEIVRHGEVSCGISGTVDFDGIEKEYKVSIRDRVRTQQINMSKIGKLRDYFGDFCAISYCPSDITLIDGSPSIRRKYLDRAIFNHKVSFLDLVKKYNKIVSERNYLLKNRASDQELDVYTDLLIDEATIYVEERLKFTEIINKKIKETYSNFLHSMTEFPEIRYRFGDKSLNLSLTNQEIRDIFKEKHLKFKAEEKFRGKTLFGPQIDDFEFSLNERKLKSIGSQGQKKSFLLALKLSEIELLSQKSPIFLVDDFTSELDEKRRECLLKYIHENRNQSFITTTNISYLPPQNVINYTKYNVAGGAVIC